MSHKEDAALVAWYKKETAARHERDSQQEKVTSPLAVKAVNGVFTVNFAENAKPVRREDLIKVFGKSRISIPAFKLC